MSLNQGEIIEIIQGNPEGQGLSRNVEGYSELLTDILCSRTATKCRRQRGKEDDGDICVLK